MTHLPRNTIGTSDTLAPVPDDSRRRSFLGATCAAGASIGHPCPLVTGRRRPRACRAGRGSPGARRGRRTAAGLPSLALCLLSSGWACGQAPHPGRYEIGFADGSRTTAHRITAWSPDPPSLKLDDRDLLSADPPLRWIRDRLADEPSAAAPWVEMWSGDRLPGQVLRYSDQPRTGGSHLPAHLTVLSVTSPFPPQGQSQAQVRVRVKCVRRVVWQEASDHYQPGSAILRDGRQVTFRALRWSADSVTLLTHERRQTIAFEDLAELNLPEQSPWAAWTEELALLAPDGRGELLQVETARGVLATTSWPRQRVARPASGNHEDPWLHGVQPAWSLDPLWLSGNASPMRRFFPVHEMPLSRIPPKEVVQRSPLAQLGRPWQRDRNVEGGWLRSGPGAFGWGFGVHAHNELHFLLPDEAISFSGFVGLDALAQSAGCVQARLRLTSTGAPSTLAQSLFETPLIVGSQQVYATGLRPLHAATAPRTLVLEVDHAHPSRPPGADPLDIRDSADWLNPLLHLDPQATASKITAQATSHIHAWSGWQTHAPAGTRLRLGSVWDELSGSASRFALAVAVQGDQPLSLVKRQPWNPSPGQLVLTVSCPLKADPPVRIEVLAAGRQLAIFDVPLLDRSHLELVPQSILLHNVEPEGSGVEPEEDRTVDFEIRQYPGSLDAPVQWHAIEFTAESP